MLPISKLITSFTCNESLAKRRTNTFACIVAICLLISTVQAFAATGAPLIQPRVNLAEIKLPIEFGQIITANGAHCPSMLACPFGVSSGPIWANWHVDGSGNLLVAAGGSPVSSGTLTCPSAGACPLGLTPGGAWSFLNVDSSGNLLVALTGGAAAVTSVFTRTGAVVAASGDYTCAQVTNCTALSGTGLVRNTGVSSELSGDVTTSGSNATTVVKINGTTLSGLSTGILRNTTTTGVPSSAELSGAVVTSGSNATTFGSVAANKWIGNNTSGSTAATASSIGTSDVSPNQYIVDSGAVNVYVATLSPAMTAYTTGVTGCFKASASNTTATPTINFNGLGAKTIVKFNNGALSNGDIGTVEPSCVIYDGANMLLLNPQLTSGSGGLARTANPSFTSISLSGTIASYNSLATTGNGAASVQAAPTAIVIGSGSSIAATSLCSTALCPAGDYDVSVYVEVTTACTTTGAYQVWLGYTDDQGAKTGTATTTSVPLFGNGVTPITATTGASLALASTANLATGHYFLHTTGAATGGLGSINYGTTATACGTGGPMVGQMLIDVTRIR